MASLVELVERFSAKTTTLKQCMELRNAAQSSACLSDLKAIHNEITDVEEMLRELKTQICVEKQQLDKGKALLQTVQQYQDGISHIANNIPSHLPGIKRENKQKQEAKHPAKEDHKPVKTTRTNNGSLDGNFPKLQYITVDDFETVPKYIKGRISYKQVNNAIDEINKVVKAKYKILSLPRSAMGEHVMKKYKAFKEAETSDTKGQFFFIDNDIKTYSSLKLDKAGRSILTILRHTGQVKEIRSGGIIRYVLKL